MSEYISKEDISRVLLERIGANKSCLSRAREKGLHETEQYFQNLVFEDEQTANLIEELSSADVRPNIHATWEKVSADKYIQSANYRYRCSMCGELTIGEPNFCPTCGADMREPKGEKGTE